ncbi:chitin-binding domain-containing protein [Salipiger mucosus]|uniref:Adenylosuccinate lyase n=1 Tax=Salipiger mucosus DSM 16094 TaxID=1123237 RepID=S9RQI7_9RHOB|nr:chitin-binding domain-containing protein [Salipiger mucosus]EPX76269.1 adenylosuccinate lyase [Salipiger mucosus DSM 16094]
MTIKTLLTAAALAAAPVAGFAACAGHSDVTMTCSEGMVFDAQSGTCKVISG